MVYGLSATILQVNKATDVVATQDIFSVKACDKHNIRCSPEGLKDCILPTDCIYCFHTI